MKQKLFIPVLLWSHLASGQVQKIDLNNETVKVSSKASPAAQMKNFENHLQWSECLKIAPQVFAKSSDIKGWVALSWLHCVEQAQKRKADIKSLEKPLATIGKDKVLFVLGPWANDLQQRWLALRLIQLEKQVQEKNKKVEREIEDLLAGDMSLDKDQKARLYQWLGERALTQSRFLEAQFLFEEAQNFKDSKYLQDKLETLYKKNNEGAVNKSRSEESSLASAEENILEERARQVLRNQDSLSVLKEVMTLLNTFPGSRTAKRLKDKPLEIYAALGDLNLKRKALQEMASGDFQRLLDWAQNFHRRGDFTAALFLSQQAVEKSPSSPQSTVALWIAGRSAHVLGQYDLALEIFANLITAHSGTEEAAEALFRSGLIQYRQQDFSAAAHFFERVLQQGRERYDLLARYWFVRALQETNKDKAQVAAQVLVDKYPFSYYGLRLSAEARGGVLTWPELKDKAPEGRAEIFLTGSQKAAWKRFKILSQAGWVNEAQAELVLIPFIKNPALKIKLAQKLVEGSQYAVAIRLINEALEKDPRLRREEYVKLGYPEIYPNLYKVESERYGVHVSFLRSLTRQESAFNLQAVSSSNALGLMQMIPSTAQEVAKKLNMKIELPEDMFRPEINIPMGSYYITQMLDQFNGHVPLALAAYNAGPNRIKTWLEARAETRELMNQASSSPSSEIWLDELPWSEPSFYVKAILRNVLLYRLVEDGNFTLKPVLWQDLLNKKSK